MTKRLNFWMELTEDEERYLKNCAAIRGISPTRLAYRLVRAVLRDELVLSVLDDGSQRIPWLPGEPREKTPSDAMEVKNQEQAALRAIKQQARVSRLMAAGKSVYWGAK